jgi:hypothetical protein
MKLLLAIFEAIPVLDKWLQAALIAYANQQREKNNEEFVQKLKEATKKKDLKAISADIGSKLK